MAHPHAKPWPIDQMIEWYQSGHTLHEIAAILASDSWQPYWREKIQSEYRPGQKIVNKVLKKRIPLRGRGAPGERNGSWKGGRRIDKSGYTLVYMPDHPNAASNGCIREHRLIAESILGRHLRSTEVVHHKDDDPSNNDPSNLMVYETNASHISETRKGQSSDAQLRGLRRANLAKQRKYNPSDVYPHDLLKQWHKGGLSLRQMATILGCDTRSVSRQLSLIGIHERQVKPGLVTEQHHEQYRQFLASRRESAIDVPA